MKLFLVFLLAAVHTDSEWKQLLGEKRYAVMRQKQTERAFSGEYLFNSKQGCYICAACSAPLFSPQDQYDSGSGWPCFTKPIESKSVYYLEDWTLPFKRYEVLCRSCDGHLGHIFPDGPPPKNFRYNINSIALKLIP